MRSLPDNASNLEASIRGRVRIGGHGQNQMNACKHRCTQTSQMSADRLEPKGKQSRPGRLTSCRRELTGLPVYRADLNPPVMNAEHGNAASLGHASRGQPERKAGQAGAALGWPKKQRPVCNEPDKPTSAWPGKARRFVEPLQLGNCNRRATPVARCTQSCRLSKGTQRTKAATRYCQMGRRA